ncbi:6016_t:CDS:2 [Scutellospora calospora]|uniref:6016_t:CDS:1 n=1 Tax=Scutellospora calospora TaxID=85575 RepID=A0ACA9L8X1_9GLOM|nr:6016_t:CDS:2 [Scutellospora calospora]
MQDFLNVDQEKRKKVANAFHSSVQKHDNIKNTEHFAQNSGTLDDIGEKKKRGQKANKSFLYEARVTKKTKNSKN